MGQSDTIYRSRTKVVKVTSEHENKQSKHKRITTYLKTGAENLRTPAFAVAAVISAAARIRSPVESGSLFFSLAFSP